MEQNFEWSVDANCYDPEHPDSPIQKSIKVLSAQSKLVTSSTKVKAGIPIDANLAVYFIKSFFDNYRIMGRDNEGFQNVELQNFDEILRAKDFDSLHEIHKKLTNKHNNLLEGFDKIFSLNYGMTLDKDLLLKILSQSKCEGVRFYLCARPIKENDTTEMHLSLVTVGVDDEGYDLNYNLPNTINKEKAKDGSDDVVTQSLTGEYTTPPPDGGGSGRGEALLNREAAEIDERYVLLRLAKGLSIS